jgi:potassium-transporting ATPase potassium-binding subunit
MTTNGWLQLAVYLGVLLALVKPLGWYMARVYAGQPCGLDRVLGPLERFIYRACGAAARSEMRWTTYAAAMLLFNAAGLLVVYGLQRGQHLLPLNPQALGSVPPDLAFNTAVSFATNTNWQSYSGETTLSYATQMLGLTVQNFVSAATGLACLVALGRGLERRTQSGIGNFWVDLTRSTLYILLPLAVVLALVLVSQGVVQTLAPYARVALVQPTTGPDGQSQAEQTLALGPVASQVAIKQLGTNGGGFFNVNSAHPFENPTPASNFLEMLAILLIPAATCYTFGKLVHDTRQGWALLAIMVALYVPFQAVCYWAEAQPNPVIAAAQAPAGAVASAPPDAAAPLGNLEGKEVRFGVAASANWAVATTCASNGSVNSMHDSYLPLGGLVPLVLMQLGEVVFGGVGSGLYGLLMFALVAVFVAGLMVGRTPEYLGKKIEAHEMKMAALAILVPCGVVLVGTAVAVVLPVGVASIANAGPHGFSEVLYAFSSAGNNNGSAFAGLNANTPFYNVLLGLAMLFARYWVAIPVLAVAGSLAAKKQTSVTAGTLPTHTPLFVALVCGVVLIVGALTFLPALALGPIAEHLALTGPAAGAPGGAP